MEVGDRPLRCDVPGCMEEPCIFVGGEQRCFPHAVARANEIRFAQGRPPVCLDDEWKIHVAH